jgi:DNA-binding CsgD family transcriptional regulator/PAS domain-containing protein
VLPRSEKVIDSRVDTPLDPRARLSPRQREVLNGILGGKPNKVIAQELGLSTRTVEAHRGAIMSKVGVSSVAELVRATSASSDNTGGLNMISRIYPGLVSFWDTSLIARFANNLHETSFGKKVDDILGRSMEEVFGASCYRHSAPFIHGVLGGKTQHFTQVVRMPSGQRTTFCSVYSPQFDALGDIEGFFAFMIESRIVPDDARDARWPGGAAARWAEMILDEDNRIVSVNDIFTDITQYEYDEVRGQTPIIIRPPGIEPTDFMKFWSDILSESRWQGTVWYRRRDGYLFRSRQQVTADSEIRGQAGCHVRFAEIKIP